MFFLIHGKFATLLLFDIFYYFFHFIASQVPLELREQTGFIVSSFIFCNSFYADVNSNHTNEYHQLTINCVDMLLPGLIKNCGIDMLLQCST